MSELSEAKEMYALAKDAYKSALATGKQYTINSGQSVTQISNEDLASLKREMQYWKGVVADLEGNGNRVKFINARGGR